MSISKYLSLDGLTDYDTLIKAKIAEGDSESLSSSRSYTNSLIESLQNECRASKAEFDSHNDNTTRHITSAERADWNAAKTHADSVHAPSDAEKNQNAFSSIAVGSTTISADKASDTLTLAGNNVTLTPTASSDKITIEVTKDNVLSALGFTPFNEANFTADNITSALGYTPWEFEANVIANLYVWHMYTGNPAEYNTTDSTDYPVVTRLDSSYVTYSKVIYADQMQFSDGKFSLVNATLMSSVSVSNMSKLLGKYIIVLPPTSTETTGYTSSTCIQIPSNATFAEQSFTSGYLSYKRIVSSAATVYEANRKLKYVAAINKDAYPDNGEHSDGYWYIYHKQLAD